MILKKQGNGRNCYFTCIDCNPHSLLDIDFIFLFHGIDYFLTNQDRVRESIAEVWVNCSLDIKTGSSAVCTATWHIFSAATKSMLQSSFPEQIYNINRSLICMLNERETFEETGL